MAVTSEQAKELVATTSKRGQPIEAEVLAEVALNKFYREDQARDEGGRFAPEGGGQPDGSPPTPGGWAKTPVPEHVREAMEQRAKAIAESLRFDRDKVLVSNEEPPTFELGGRMNSYAGAYYADVGGVKVWARVTTPEWLPHLMSHEIQHDRYHVTNQIRDAEHKAILALPPEEHKRLFEVSGYPRSEAMAEVEKRWPMSALWGRTWGDSYISGGEYPNKQMVKDDGVTSYSKEWWTSEAMKKNGAYSSAINETLAEISRVQDRVGEEFRPKISKEWLELHDGIRARYDYEKGKPAILPRPPGVGH